MNSICILPEEKDGFYVLLVLIKFKKITSYY
jgi:hypothetical protein